MAMDNDSISEILKTVYYFARMINNNFRNYDNAVQMHHKRKKKVLMKYIMKSPIIRKSERSFKRYRMGNIIIIQWLNKFSFLVIIKVKQ